MQTQTQIAERRELLLAIDALPDDSVIAMLNFLKSLQSNTMNDNDDGFYNPANLRRLDHSIEQLRQGKVVVKTIDELERTPDE